MVKWGNWGILEKIIKNVTLARLLKSDHLVSTPRLHFISTYRVDAAVEVGQQAEAGFRVLQSSSDPPCHQH